MIRHLAALCAVIVLPATAATAQTPSDGSARGARPGAPEATIRMQVGVRSDAEPFVFSRSARFADVAASDTIPDDTDGFLFDLCREILDAAGRAAGFDYDFVPVTAGDRIGAMGTDGALHMLCDPFTMTRERAGAYHFTPVVFVSGGSFLHWERTGDGTDNDARAYRWGRDRLAALLRTGDQPVVAWNGTVISKDLDAPLPDGPRQRLNDDAVSALPWQTEVRRCDDPAHREGQIRSIRVGIVKGSTAAQIVNNALAITDPLEILRSKHETVCYETFDTHPEGLAELCKTDRGDRPPLSYYFGDRDIIVSNLEALQTSAADGGAGTCSRIRAARRFYSVEPYAFPISTRVPDRQILAIRKALLDFASTPVGEGRRRTTRMVELFDTHFDGKVPSPTLQAVFSLLVVPAQ